MAVENHVNLPNLFKQRMVVLHFVIGKDYA